MQRYCLILILTLYCAGTLHAQELIPRPYAFAGPEGMGGGYARVAMTGGAGLRIDSRHLLLDSNAWYDNGHKINDNDQPNPKGHDRGLDGSAYFRLRSGWSLGAGARWSELSTTNYRKSSWRPTFGGSKDYFHQRCQGELCVPDFSARVGVDYVLSGSDWSNGSQGPLFSLYMPSPSAKAHIFYRETIGIYRFHDTVTNRSDPILTREQTGNHSWDSFVEVTAMYRF